jgi:hypothetical protein
MDCFPPAIEKQSDIVKRNCSSEQFTKSFTGFLEENYRAIFKIQIDPMVEIINVTAMRINLGCKPEREN